jgi:triosephosphate isomerase
MRTKLIAGNWKMNTTLADAHVLADGIRNGLEDVENIDVLLCPPSIWLTELAQRIAPGSLPHLKLGAQNMYFEEKGAFTGEISPLMVKEVAEYVLIGHSERVHVFGEQPDMLTAKVQAAFAHGITPILCIGEDVQAEGSKRQLVHALNHLVKELSHEQLEQLIVAYEPVWAIGTGKAATPEYAQEVIAALRTGLTPATRILYGGSATDENAKTFLEQEDIDGLLVGGASLKLKVFLTMCQVAADLS